MENQERANLDLRSTLFYCSVTSAFTMIISVCLVLQWEPVFNNEKIMYALYALDSTAEGRVDSISTGIGLRDLTKPFNFPGVDTWTRGRQIGYLIDLFADKIRARSGWGINQYAYGGEILLITLASVILAQILFFKIGFRRYLLGLPTLIFFCPFLLIGQSIVFRSGKYITLPLLLLMGLLLLDSRKRKPDIPLLICCASVVISPFIDEATFLMCGAFFVIYSFLEKKWKQSVLAGLLCVITAAVYWIYSTEFLPKLCRIFFDYPPNPSKGSEWLASRPDIKGIIKSLIYSSIYGFLGVPLTSRLLAGITFVLTFVCLVIGVTKVKQSYYRLFLGYVGAVGINEVLLYRGFMHNQTFVYYHAAWGCLAYLGILIVVGHAIDTKDTKHRLGRWIGILTLFMFLVCQLNGFKEARKISLARLGINNEILSIYQTARLLNNQIRTRSKLLQCIYPGDWINGKSIPRPDSSMLSLNDGAYFISVLLLARGIERGHIQLSPSKTPNLKNLTVQLK